MLWWVAIGEFRSRDVRHLRFSGQMISCGFGDISGKMGLFTKFFFQPVHRQANNSLVFDIRRAILKLKI
jgi:hypothetical protein